MSDEKYPTVTVELIENAIQNEHYIRIEDTTVTVCTLIMKNGFSVVSHSACVSLENFDVELGQKIARQKAIDQCWALLGFQLASTIAQWNPFLKTN